MSVNEWPDSFALDDAPESAVKIRAFIDEQMAALKAFDLRREAWVRDNLPSSYRMTYYFHDHAHRVAEDIRRTALHMGLGERVAENLFWAMLPHDIGKKLLPVHIWDTIEKPENDLKTLRRSHTELGITIVDKGLAGIGHPFIGLMKDIMLNHHEQMDGGGFLGKKGDELSAPVRLACIIESFDGYSITRPHFGKRDISVAGVLNRMREAKGDAIYDMELFEAFAAAKLAEAQTG